MAKKILSNIIGFFLFVLSICLIVLIILSNTILKKQYVLDLLEKSKYYENTYNNIKNDFENYIIQSGIDESRLEDLCSIEQVKNDVNDMVSTIYDGQDIKLDTQIISNKINNIIYEILQENNRIPSKEEKEAIEIFEKNMSRAYEKNIVFDKNNVLEIQNIIKKIEIFVERAVKILLASCLIVVVLIILINRKLIEIIKIIGTSVIATGIVSILIKLLIQNRIKNILILNKAFSNSLIMLMNNIINTILITGIIAVIIGCILVILCNIKEQNIEGKNKIKNKK